MSSPSSPAAPQDTAPTPEEKPSSTLYGGATLGLLWVMAAIILSYTLLDIPWQQRLGGWNYVIALAILPVLSVLMKRWRPDTRRFED